MRNFFFLFVFFLSIPLAQAFGQGSGYSLNLDGNNDYIDCGSSNNLDRAESSFTIEAWVKLESYANDWVAAIVSNRHVSLAQGSLFFVRGSYDGSNVGKLALDCHRSSGSRMIFSVNQVPLNEWCHVAVTYEYNGSTNNNTASLYINGVQENTASSMSDIRVGAIVNPTHVGNEFANTSHDYGLDGNIDEVRIWNKALTQTEIRTNMCEKLTGSEPNLVAYYRMDEGADNTCSGGEDVCDLTGNNNHGVKF